MNDEFYIGYLKKAPAQLARLMRRTSLGLLAAILCVAAIAALAQQRLARGSFEFGVITEVSGRVATDPVPHLVVESSEHPELIPGRAAVLVGEGKHGMGKTLASSDGENAALTGSVISNGDTVMFEVHGLAALPAATTTLPLDEAVEEKTLEGELVDTKCFLGVMRPGRGKVHRGCAIACLEGGIPAGLWLRENEEDEGSVVFIANDDAYRAQVKPEWAALRVRISGRYGRVDGIPTLWVREAVLLGELPES